MREDLGSSCLVKFNLLPFDSDVFIRVDYRIIVVACVDDITTAVSRSDINACIDHQRSRFKLTVCASVK